MRARKNATVNFHTLLHGWYHSSFFLRECIHFHIHIQLHSVLDLGLVFWILWKGKEGGNSLLFIPCRTNFYWWKPLGKERKVIFRFLAERLFCLRAKSSLARELKARKQIFLSHIWGGQRRRCLEVTSYIRIPALKNPLKFFEAKNRTQNNTLFSRWQATKWLLVWQKVFT